MNTKRLGMVGWMGLFAVGFGEERSEPQPPIDGIRDNSFLIEEAYNQEPGVVQHVWTARFGADHRDGANSRTWDLDFSQEWPIFTQRHQFAYAIPYAFVDEDAENASGIGDVELNYRYQLFMEEEGLPAVSPSLSLILPTGDEDRGFGTGRVGYSFNLPVSKTISSRMYMNLNAGVTLTPGVQARLSTNRRSREFDLLDFNVGASVFYALTEKFHVVLEATWESIERIEEFDPRGSRRPRRRRERGDEVTLAPGFRWAWDLPGDLQIVPGVAFPIGLTEQTVDYGVFLYFSVEHPFTTTTN